MGSLLKNRVEKLEGVLVKEEESRPAPVNAEFKAYVRSEDYLRDLDNRAAETLETMSAEHRGQALAYWRLVDGWWQRRTEAIEQGRYKEWSDDYSNAFPSWSLPAEKPFRQQTMGRLIAQMICDKFNDQYFGPFTIPPHIAELWLEKSPNHVSGQWNCEECGYWFPFFNPRIEKCLLCSGKVGYYAYEFKHGLKNPYVRAGGYRDEYQRPILTEHYVLEALGILLRFDRFKAFEVTA